ncbi:MAG TPA: hypothetical protein VL625_05770 [Patescibacteria group bacterium]|jgi:hypothetical protein|nr:hypothetical protein [Patescibacteria group bacterium]
MTEYEKQNQKNKDQNQGGSQNKDLNNKNRQSPSSEGSDVDSSEQ